MFTDFRFRDRDLLAGNKLEQRARLGSGPLEEAPPNSPAYYEEQRFLAQQYACICAEIDAEQLGELDTLGDAMHERIRKQQRERIAAAERGSWGESPLADLPPDAHERQQYDARLQLLQLEVPWGYRRCACGHVWRTRPEGCDCIAPQPATPEDEIAWRRDIEVDP